MFYAPLLTFGYALRAIGNLIILKLIFESVHYQVFGIASASITIINVISLSWVWPIGQFIFSNFSENKAGRKKLLRVSCQIFSSSSIIFFLIFFTCFIFLSILSSIPLFFLSLIFIEVIFIELLLLFNLYHKRFLAAFKFLVIPIVLKISIIICSDLIGVFDAFPFLVIGFSIIISLLFLIFKPAERCVYEWVLALILNNWSFAILRTRIAAYCMWKFLSYATCHVLYHAHLVAPIVVLSLFGTSEGLASFMAIYVILSGVSLLPMVVFNKLYLRSILSFLSQGGIITVKLLSGLVALCFIAGGLMSLFVIEVSPFILDMFFSNNILNGNEILAYALWVLPFKFGYGFPATLLLKLGAIGHHRSALVRSSLFSWIVMLFCVCAVSEENIYFGLVVSEFFLFCNIIFEATRSVKSKNILRS